MKKSYKASATSTNQRILKFQRAWGAKIDKLVKDAKNGCLPDHIRVMTAKEMKHSRSSLDTMAWLGEEAEATVTDEEEEETVGEWGTVKTPTPKKSSKKAKKQKTGTPPVGSPRSLRSSNTKRKKIQKKGKA